MVLHKLKRKQRSGVLQNETFSVNNELTITIFISDKQHFTGK